MPRSTDGTDPKTWDPALDAVKSGARNHVVIYEDKEIRVLSVTNTGTTPLRLIRVEYKNGFPTGPAK